MLKLLLTLLLFAATLIAVPEKSLPMIFAHGLADTYRQAYNWHAKHKLNIGEIIAENFPDATEQFWRVNFPWTSLGQDNEIESLKEVVESYQNEHPDKRIILSGLSRGAATVINYTALHQPQNVAALILISPFSSMRDIAKHIIKNSFLCNIPYAEEISRSLIGCIFWQYSDSGVHPIDVVTKIDHQIPILFVSLKNDHLVPCYLTKRLVEKLISNGHKKVHHLILENGQHGKPLADEEGKALQACIQAFSKFYRLPHDPDSAKSGQAIFAGTFPTFFSYSIKA